MAGRPAGFSSDEENFSDEGFELYSSYLPAKKKSYRTDFDSDKPEQSLEEKFFDAVKNGEDDVVADCIKKGVNVNGVDKGWSALMHACFYSNVNVVARLLEHGADIKFHKDFYTPLMAVCNGRSSKENRVQCAELLLRNGIEADMPDRFQTTALMLAAKEGYCKLVEQMIEHGCKVNKTDRNGWTPLFYAVQNERADIVDVLVKAGAILKLKDTSDQTAYELAIIKEFKSIAEKVAFEDTTQAKMKVAPDVPVTNILDAEDMMIEIPTRNGGQELSGFPSDVFGLLLGMNLQNLAYLFYKNRIQLGEFLVIRNERLKEIGLQFSYHRNRILYSLKQFHLQQWVKTSVGYKPNTEKMEIIDGVKMMGNTVRQLHVLQSTLLFLDQRKPKQGLTAEFLQPFHKGKHQVSLMKNELYNLQDFAKQLNNKVKLAPADLIEARRPRSFFTGVFVKVCAAGVIGLLLWKNKIANPFLYVRL